MSWWRTVGGNMIGDVPADLLGRAFKNLAKARDTRGQPKPTLAAILEATAAVIRGNPGEFLSGGSGVEIEKITARLDGEPGSISGDARGTANVEIGATLRDAFGAVAQAYQEQWGRKPSLYELLDTMAFVLRYKPETYLTEAEGLSIKDIVAGDRGT